MCKIRFFWAQFIFLINIIAASYCQAEVFEAPELKTFIKNGGYGAGIGAAVGLALVAISDQPSSNTRDVARGASLGLYAGIIYGISEWNQSQPRSLDWGVVPIFNKNDCDGLRLFATIFEF